MRARKISLVLTNRFGRVAGRTLIRKPRERPVGKVVCWKYHVLAAGIDLPYEGPRFSCDICRGNFSLLRQRHPDDVFVDRVFHCNKCGDFDLCPNCANKQLAAAAASDQRPEPRPFQRSELPPERIAPVLVVTRCFQLSA